MLKYKTSISEIGELALELFNESGSLVLFDDNAPPELGEISVLHKRASLDSDVKIGDELLIANSIYKIDQVGTEANHTLKTQGHCTLVFNAKNEDLLPGQIMVTGAGFPTLFPGDLLAFR